mgnify:CR=1 FL=1
MPDLRLIWEESAGNTFTVRALVRGRTVGVARGHWSECTCELEWVGVQAEWRRCGVGHSLVRQVQSHFRHITACPVNADGAALIRGCGFVPSPESVVCWTWSENGLLIDDRDF